MATSTPALADIIEWDIPNWSVALEFWRAQSRQDPSSLHALEIGSRHGGLSLWAAMKGMTVLCTDLEGPSEEAVAKHKRYEVSERIKYEALDALDIHYTDTFDVVLFKSVLGGIGRMDHKERQAQAIREIHKSLKKGGELWFAENLVASPLHRFFRRHYVEWGKTWRYVTVPEMQDHLSIFSEVAFRTVGFLGNLGRTPLQRSIMGRLDRILVDKLVPETWRYIIMGVARK